MFTKDLVPLESISPIVGWMGGFDDFVIKYWNGNVKNVICVGVSMVGESYYTYFFGGILGLY
jgi:hypothetical protein